MTRPAAQAEAWVARLLKSGFDAVALPLIEIGPAADAGAVAAAWAALASRALVVFVSTNAVLHFFAAHPQAAWPAGLLAAAPGPGTADALRAAGVPAAAVVEPAPDSASFDSESLWLRLRGGDWHGRGVLLVRGDGGREWLAERLVEAGATVDAVAAYRRALPAFAGAERERLDALVAAADVAWLFSSSQAIDHLEQVAGAGRWAQAAAVATHPRIAARARAAGFGRVVESGPRLDDVVACIQSIRP